MPSPVRLDWYDTPLYYDIIFDADTARETDFLEAIWSRHGQTRSRRPTSLELACGSGRLVRELASRGWKTAGFDLNPAMLAFARERMEGAGLDSLLWEDRMEAFTVPDRGTFDLVHCLVSTFKYLLTESDALACLERVAAVLKPAGLLVLGIHLTNPARDRPSHERWVASRDGIEVVCNTRTWPANGKSRLEPMRSRLRVTLPDGARQDQETRWVVRSYTASQLRHLLRKCKDLTVVACHDFRHDADQGRRFDDEYADLVLVLRKQAEEESGIHGLDGVS